MANIKDRNRKTYLYRITNLINGKDYVGIAFKYRRRWEEHVRDSKKPESDDESLIAKAIRKYGRENFKFEVISIARTWDIAADLEQLARALGMGAYNKTIGGEGNPVQTPETRQLKSDRMKEIWADPVQRAQRVAAIARGTSTPEAKQNMSAGIRRAYEDPEVWERRSQIAQNMWADPEFRVKQSEGCKAAWNPERKESHAKQVSSRYDDPEYSANHSQSMKQMWVDKGGFPEETKEILRQINLDPEYQRKRVEKLKATCAKRNALKPVVSDEERRANKWEYEKKRLERLDKISAERSSRMIRINLLPS